MEAFTWQKANSVEKGARQSMNVGQGVSDKIPVTTLGVVVVVALLTEGS